MNQTPSPQIYLPTHDQLIISADDFGYSLPRNTGIVQLLKAGKITSVSVLVNAWHVEKSSVGLKHLMLNRNVSVGLHFNLTEGHPVGKGQCEMVGQKGQFRGKPWIYQFFQNLDSTGKRMPLRIQEFVRTEFRLQVQAFIRLFGCRPEHVDGHNHVHVVQQITQIIAPIMRQNAIYKVRLPNQNLKGFSQKFPHNKVFTQNAKNAKKIFDRYDIIYPTNFIGLEQINQLNIERIRTKICQATEQKQHHSPKVIQLMTHPGYADPTNGDQFNQSKDRQVEMNRLRSEQFQLMIGSRPELRLVSFNQLAPVWDGEIDRRRILLYSKMNAGSGNWTTSLRLERVFRELGYTVYLRSIQEALDTQQETRSLSRFLIQFRITLVVGVNLTRAARIIYEATRSTNQITNRVPYVFIVAGTDANIYFNTVEAVEVLREPIRECSMLISLSQSMMGLTETFLVDKLGYRQGQKGLVLLGQSSNILAYQAKSAQELDQIHHHLKTAYNLSILTAKYIIFPASFRPVKDIQFLLPQFHQLTLHNPGLRILLLGPILDHPYYLQCLPSLSPVQYLGSVQKPTYLQLLKHAQFLVNSSISQGQCCSIQQALQVGQVCVVRDNEGNAELVQDGRTGFLFATEGEFGRVAGIVLAGQGSLMIDEIKSNARKYHAGKFGIEVETGNYKRIIEGVLNQGKKLFTYDDVHPVSEVNLQLYQLIPQNYLNQWFENSKHPKRVIDIGCGSGIFGFNIVNRFDLKYRGQIQLELYDFDNLILSNCYYNCLQKSQSTLIGLKSVKIKQSDMFENIQSPQAGNLYVANLPQTPFKNQKTRPDKNGGHDCLKFNQKLIRQFSIFNPSSMLIMLFSHMSNPTVFFSLLSQLHLQVIWKSPTINHQIPSTTYDSIEQNLSQFLKTYISQGKGDVQIKQQQDGRVIFYVPAQILIIQRVE